MLKGFLFVVILILLFGLMSSPEVTFGPFIVIVGFIIAVICMMKGDDEFEKRLSIFSFSNRNISLPSSTIWTRYCFNLFIYIWIISIRRHL